MNKALILEKTRDFVKDKMYKEGSGHDWFHVERVCNMSKYLAQKKVQICLLLEMTALFT